MTAYEFISGAEKLIGQPYSKIDCIGVIRKALKISCQGTNWLWRSVNNSSKYRYLTSRNTNNEYYDGCVIFKVAWGEKPDGYTDTPNCYHVGIVCDGGINVIHSSPSMGVRKEKIVPGEWEAWGTMKQVDYTNQSIEKPDLNSDDFPLTDRQILIALYKKLVND